MVLHMKYMLQKVPEPALPAVDHINQRKYLLIGQNSGHSRHAPSREVHDEHHIVAHFLLFQGHQHIPDKGVQIIDYLCLFSCETNVYFLPKVHFSIKSSIFKGESVNCSANMKTPLGYCSFIEKRGTLGNVPLRKKTVIVPT